MEILRIPAEKKRADDAEGSAAALREELGAAHQKAEAWMEQAHAWQGKASEDKKVESRLRGEISALESDLAVARAQAGRISPSELIHIQDEARREAEQIVAESHREELADKDATIESLKAELKQAQESAEQSGEQQTLVDIIQDAVKQMGEKINVLQGHYLKVKGRNPKIEEAIRNLVARQIGLMSDRFDIEPV